MSLEQLDDSEFLSHVAWLAEERRPFPVEAVARLKSMADIGPSRIVVSQETQETYEQGYAEGREAERMERAEHEADRDRECPTFSVDMTDADFREVGEAVLQIRIPATYAETISHGLSDLLCWTQGFSAALGADDLDRRPMGIEWVRRVREAITKAQRAATKA